MMKGKKNRGFPCTFGYFLWLWKVLERNFWDTTLAGIAAPSLIKPDLLNLDMEKQGFMGHPLGVSTEVFFIQFIICCKQLAIPN